MMQPDFMPGRGWHRIDGLYSPGSSTDLEKRRERAWPCWVLPMRERGVLLTPDVLLDLDPLPGALLMVDAGGIWNASLLDRGDISRELRFLAAARLVRERDGVRQYQGREREDGVPHWPQTWLCTTTPERSREILHLMAEREW